MPAAWRRVDMATDLRCLYTRLKEVCDDEVRNGFDNGFYLLSVTLDEAPPDFESKLRLYDGNGTPLPTRKRVFWLNRCVIEKSLTAI
jgi:hypothetical protein